MLSIVGELEEQVYYSLPCELRFDARPTVAHTGGYLLLKMEVTGPNRDPTRNKEQTSLQKQLLMY